jgi:hypothetical protein
MTSLIEHRFVIHGAAGGQGTTAVALAAGVFLARHTPTLLIAHDPDQVCAVAAVPHTDRSVDVAPGLTLACGDPDAIPAHPIVVIDGGVFGAGLADWPDSTPTTRWAVVRGPCYLALRRLVCSPWRPDGIVLLSEQHRALHRHDLEDVTGLPVVADVPVEAATARAIDAGLFVSRIATLHAFRPLAAALRRHDPTTIPDAA